MSKGDVGSPKADSSGKVIPTQNLKIEELALLGSFLHYAYVKDQNLRRFILKKMLPEIKVALDVSRLSEEDKVMLGIYFHDFIQRNPTRLDSSKTEYLRNLWERYIFESGSGFEAKQSIGHNQALIPIFSNSSSLPVVVVEDQNGDHFRELFLEYILVRQRVESENKVQPDNSDVDLADWQVIPDNIQEDSTSLITYKKVNETVQFGLHPILTERVYQDLLDLNDLSYALAKTHSHAEKGQEKQDLIQNRVDELTDRLSDFGWEDYQLFYGYSGAKNVDEDAVGFVIYNPRVHVIAVIFHGSRNGSKNPFFNSGKGDWGSNYDSVNVSGVSLGIQDMPDHIMVHRGFANNFQSSQKGINERIDSILNKIGPEDLKKTWVIISGHSKGAAVASVSIPVIKNHIRSLGGDRAQANVGAVLLSVPRAFNGDDSQKWVHTVVGKRNIIRINVQGDPVPQVPFKRFGFRSLGMLVLDQIRKVNARASSKYGRDVSAWTELSSWAGYHYGCGLRGAGLEFDPVVVLPYQELLDGLNLGNQHIFNQGGNPLSTTTFGVPNPN